MNDNLQQCMGDLKTSDTKAFTETFCQRCRNSNCKHAVWALDKFARRVELQPDRLLHPTQIKEPSSRYEHLKDFTEMRAQADQIERNRKDRDWGATPELYLPDPTEELAQVEEAGDVVLVSPNKPVAVQIRPGNTNTSKDIMLDEGPSPIRTPAKAPVYDPWAVESAPKKIGRVPLVAPGAKVRLGG
jgi:hypothetical protein